MKIPRHIENIISLAGDPKRAEADIVRFEDAYLKKLGHAFSWETKGAEILVRVFGNSHTLSNRLIAYPVWADEILASPYLYKRKPRDVLEKELFESPASEKCLRHFKYREMLRIVVRDLAKLSPTREMLLEWSDIADVIVGAAYSMIFDRLSKDIPASPCAGTIIALGKLGGTELNLSSDIDILVIYETDFGSIAAADGTELTNHEFFVRLAADITRSLSLATDEGFIFRVDNELRPEGHQGALANSLDAAIRYYEHFGRDWERQALIRARPIAGNIPLGEKFVREITPFVYRRSMGIADISHMREMKSRMADRALLNSDAADIKHSEGGIREAEFFVQALLILHGGARAGLRRQNTFDAIDALVSESLLRQGQALLLTEAYSFLRRLENMLQAEDDIQTHALPSSPEGLFSLARRMGYGEKKGEDAAAHLKTDIKTHTSNIGKLFGAIFEEDYNKFELKEAIEDNVSNASNEEEEADSLAWFVKMETGRIAHLDIEGKISTRDTLKKLSLVAEVTVQSAWEIAARHLKLKHGAPASGGKDAAGFAVIAMGKLGSFEMDYGSDLDLCFIYSGVGLTSGPSVIPNVEFFTKLAQRILSLVSLPTRYGRAYLVDSELRPSGNSGTLVISLDSFEDYHKERAGIWERLALLKARVIAGDEDFVRQTAKMISTLAFELAPPPAENTKKEITHLRERTLREISLVRDGSFNIKHDRGGIAEIESVIQYHQLMKCNQSRALHRQSTFDILEALFKEEFIGKKEYSDLNDCLRFMRRLLSQLRLVTKSSTNTIDFGTTHAKAVATSLGYKDPKSLEEETAKHRKIVQGIYGKSFSYSA